MCCQMIGIPINYRNRQNIFSFLYGSSIGVLVPLFLLLFICFLINFDDIKFFKIRVKEPGQELCGAVWNIRSSFDQELNHIELFQSMRISKYVYCIFYRLKNIVYIVYTHIRYRLAVCRRCRRCRRFSNWASGGGVSRNPVYIVYIVYSQLWLFDSSQT